MKGLLIALGVAVALTAVVIWYVFDTKDPDISRTRALVAFFGLFCFVIVAGVWSGQYLRGLGEALNDRLTAVAEASTRAGELLRQSELVLSTNTETAREIELLRLRLHEALNRLREQDAGADPDASG